MEDLKKFSFKSIPKLTKDYNDAPRYFACVEDLISKLENNDDILKILSFILKHHSTHEAFNSIRDIKYNNFNEFKKGILASLFPGITASRIYDSLVKLKQGQNESNLDFINKFNSKFYILKDLLPDYSKSKYFLDDITFTFMKNCKISTRFISLIHADKPIDQIFENIYKYEDIPFFNNFNGKIEENLLEISKDIPAKISPEISNSYEITNKKDDENFHFNKHQKFQNYYQNRRQNRFESHNQFKPNRNQNFNHFQNNYCHAMNNRQFYTKPRINFRQNIPFYHSNINNNFQNHQYPMKTQHFNQHYSNKYFNSFKQPNFYNNMNTFQKFPQNFHKNSILSSQSIKNHVFNIKYTGKKYGILLDLPIFKKPLKILVDSGSTLSILKLSAIKDTSKILNYQKHKIYGINLNPIYTVGNIFDVLSSKSTSIAFNFSIVNDNDISLGEEISGIIGTDILRECTISLIDNRLSFKTKRFALPLIELNELLYENPQNYCENILTIDHIPEYGNFKPILNPHKRCDILINQVSLNHLDSHLTKNKIKDLIYKYNKTFYIKNDILKACTLFKHQIRLKTNRPLFRKQFPHNPHMEFEIDKHINNLLKADVIEPCVQSSYNSACFLVPKKNGDYRFVVDLKHINSEIIPNKYANETPENIFNRLSDSIYFTKCDLKFGYFQMLVDKRDQHILAFTHRGNRFKFKRLVMGMTDSAASFAQMVTMALGNYVNDFVEIYIDDLIIHTKSNNLNDHLHHIDLVLQRLTENNLTIEISKTEFIKKEIDFLGFTIKYNTISPSSKNVESIRNMPYPNTIKQVRQFLGACNFFRRHIKNFADKVKPLNELLKKNTKFEFNYDCKEAFDKMKKIITEKPVLSIPNYNRIFIIQTDASDYCLGAALLQVDNYGREYAIHYHSRTLSNEEKNYSVFEREFLAIVEAVTKKFYKYIIGRKFIIQTDCCPILYALNSNIDEGSSKVIRGKVKLSSFDFKIVHKAGVKNKLADFLSRIVEIPENKIILANENTKVVNKTPNIAVIRNIGTTYAVTRAKKKKDIIDYSKQYWEFLKIINETKDFKENKIVKYVNSNLELKPSNHFNLFFVTRNGDNIQGEGRKLFNSLPAIDNIIINKKNIFVIYKNNSDEETIGEKFYGILNELRFNLRENKLHDQTFQIHNFSDNILNLFDLEQFLAYIFKNDSFLFKIIENTTRFLEDEDEIYEIIKQNHESLVGGHAGSQRTLKRLQRLVKFARMKENVDDFVRNCRSCQLNKITNKVTHINKVTSTPTTRNEIVSIDIVGPLPLTRNNNRYILTIVDNLTRYVVAVAIPDMTANTVAEALTNHYFLIYSPPKIIVSDQGRNFTSEIFEQLMKIFGTKKFFSTPYYPQGNSLIERQHKTLKDYLRQYLQQLNTEQWDEILNFAIFNYNSHQNVSTYSPFQLTYGVQPNLPHENVENVITQGYDFDNYINRLKNNLKYLHDNTARITNKVKEQRVQRLNEKAEEYDFKLGQKVKILSHHQGEGSKLRNIYNGPHTIVGTHNDNEYYSVMINGKVKKMNKRNIYPYYDDDYNL
jgi:hypothetical protein